MPFSGFNGWAAAVGGTGTRSEFGRDTKRTSLGIAIIAARSVALFSFSAGECGCNEERRRKEGMEKTPGAMFAPELVLRREGHNVAKREGYRNTMTAYPFEGGKYGVLAAQAIRWRSGTRARFIAASRKIAQGR